MESSDSDDDKNSVTVSYKSSRTGVSLTIIIALDVYMYHFRQKHTLFTIYSVSHFLMHHFCYIYCIFDKQAF